MGSAPSRATFYLVTRKGSEPEQVVVWDTVEVTVGRSDDSDIRIDDHEVSRHHARFWRRDADCVVEDLGSGLGSWINGERVTRHDLRHGDVVTIGSVEIRFGQTTGSIKRASNVSFASDLKEFGLVASVENAGRTMLGFDTDDDLVPTREDAPAPREVRAVTLDGEVDVAAVDDPAMEIGLPEAEFGEALAVRDLDLELAAPPAAAPVAQPVTATGAVTAPTLVQAEGTSPAVGEVTVKLVLEVTGPAQTVEAFLSAVRDKPIAVPPLALLLRDL